MTNEKPSNTLEQHYLWVELAVLSQFLVNLSFNNYLNGKYMYMYMYNMYKASMLSEAIHSLVDALNQVIIISLVLFIMLLFIVFISFWYYAIN